MLDLKPKWYPSLPLEVAVIWHTHELSAVETSDSDCVSDLLAPVLVKPFLCSFNFPNVSFSKEREGGKKSYTVLGFFVGGGFFCFFLACVI